MRIGQAAVHVEARTPTFPNRTSKASIEVSFEYVDERNLDIPYLRHALSVLESVPATENIRVIVTSEMNASLASRVPDQRDSPFRQDRTSGRVTAKTVTHADRTDILLDAAVLLPGVRDHLDGDIRRLLRHEGHHLVLRAHDEDAQACVSALRVTDPAYVLLAWPAALVLEEYRIEAALCDEGEHGAPPRLDLLPLTLTEIHEALTRSGNHWGSGQGDRVLDLATQLFTRAAYAAASHRFAHPIDERLTHDPYWKALVAPAWSTLLHVTQELPRADARMSRLDVEQAMRDLTALVEMWFLTIGVEIGSDQNGAYLIPVADASDGTTA